VPVRDMADAEAAHELLLRHAFAVDLAVRPGSSLTDLVRLVAADAEHWRQQVLAVWGGSK